MNWLKKIFSKGTANKAFKGIKKFFTNLFIEPEIGPKMNVTGLKGVEPVDLDKPFGMEDTEPNKKGGKSQFSAGETQRLRNHFYELIDLMEEDFASDTGNLDYMRYDVGGMSGEQMENLINDSVFTKLEVAYNEYMQRPSEGLRKQFEYYAKAVISEWSNLIDYYQD